MDCGGSYQRSLTTLAHNVATLVASHLPRHGCHHHRLLLVYEQTSAVHLRLLQLLLLLRVSAHACVHHRLLSSYHVAAHH